LDDDNFEEGNVKEDNNSKEGSSKDGNNDGIFEDSKECA
jgi:hypothetical protein